MVYFISDLHLGASYIANHRAHEARVTAFLDSIASNATELYLLGDVLDYWYEYRTVVPRGYVRFFGVLARMADAGVRITWLTGNHDIWLFDYLRDEIGLEVVDAPYVVREFDGRRFILAHGDRIGTRKASFRFICHLFRNRLCQKLYSAIHPRWTVGLAHGWSSASRKSSGYVPVGIETVVEREADTLALAVPGTDYVVLGHHHIAHQARLPQSGAELIVLGDWIDKDTYACWDGKTLRLESFRR